MGFILQDGKTKKALSTSASGMETPASSLWKRTVRASSTARLMQAKHGLKDGAPGGWMPGLFGGRSEVTDARPQHFRTRARFAFEGGASPHDLRACRSTQYILPDENLSAPWAKCRSVTSEPKKNLRACPQVFHFSRHRRPYVTSFFF